MPEDPPKKSRRGGIHCCVVHRRMRCKFVVAHHQKSGGAFNVHTVEFWFTRCLANWPNLDQALPQFFCDSPTCSCTSSHQMHGLQPQARPTSAGVYRELRTPWERKPVIAPAHHQQISRFILVIPPTVGVHMPDITMAISNWIVGSSRLWWSTLPANLQKSTSVLTNCPPLHFLHRDVRARRRRRLASSHVELLDAVLHMDLRPIATLLATAWSNSSQSFRAEVVFPMVFQWVQALLRICGSEVVPV